MQEDHTPMKKNLLALALAAALLFTLVPAAGFAAASGAGGRLVVYTSVPTKQLNMAVAMFNDQYPGIVVDVFSAKDAVLLSRVQAEGGTSRGDVLLGGSEAAFHSVESLLVPYLSKNLSAIHEAYLAQGTAYTPVQLNVSAMIVNPAAARQLGADVKGWESLKDEKLSGKVLYMDPARFSADERQVAFINMVADTVNIASPSAPSFVLNAVNAGQFAVGITSEDKAIEYKADNKDLQILYAQEGTAVSASYAGILAGADNEKNAQLFIDFLTSKAYQQAAADELYLRSVRTDVDFALKGVVRTSELRAVNYDAMTLRLTANADFVAKR